jgi:WD40-like Beta Propeller Repeat
MLQKMLDWAQAGVLITVAVGCGGSKGSGFPRGSDTNTGVPGSGGMPNGTLGSVPNGNGSSGALNPAGGAPNSVVTPPKASSANGNFTAPDCNGCTFPPSNAPPCPGGAPKINLAYPPDGVLVPPNMNVMSVQWTPFGAFKEFEVDFKNAITDTRIVTQCAMQTMDTGQPPAPSAGCELVISPQQWAFLVAANRGGDPVAITVRGTTDGACASMSTSTTHLQFAEQDLLGGIYYWKSTVSANGTGGQIWVKSFGDSNPEQQVTGTGGALAASCNGCHALSRDGLRMTVYSDDDDSDDEYGDVTGSLIDMATKMPIGMAYAGRRTGQPPGFSSFSPDHSLYLTSNGLPNPPANVFALWSGGAGTQSSTITLGTGATDRPTMPDWSPDGKSVVYVLPTQVAAWDLGGGRLGGGGGGRGGGGGGGGGRADDDHVFGGSLYTVAYSGNQMFGAPAPFLKSGGENNYYPSYSPDGQYIVFDRAAHDASAGTLDGCLMAPHPLCPNDSFSNPAARLMLTPAAASAPVDLEAANGSPAAMPVPVSNSWPRWSPFLQTYRGNRLLWVAFSSTRDYGIRVRNHQTGMYQCYPADSAALPGADHGNSFDPLCQQPQLWMAPIDLSAAAAGKDPSRIAFWLPFQDITTHNHTPQWTQQVANMPPPATCIASGGNCLTNPGACCAGTCNANGTCQQTLVR